MPFEGLLSVANNNKPVLYYKNIKGLCTHFKNSNNEVINNNVSARDNMQDNEFALRNDTVKDRIYFKNSEFTTIEQWTNFFANNDVILEYETVEETIEAYTEEQQAVYNKLQKLLLYKHYNSITCTDEVSCKMKLTYRPDKIMNLEARLEVLENK